MKYFLVLIPFFAVFSVLAQETEEKLIFGSTDKTSEQPKYSTKDKKDKNPKIRSIITNSNKKTLPGNKCFSDYMYTLGLKYEFSTRGKKVYSNGFYRVIHNIGVKTITTLRKGPFWGIKVRKQRKKCILLMHDYPG
ncbi:MAG: hypothetical protein OEW75_11605 [Cyclobacteriaceae bacterium]|nr:hypothetical protein [Cyclobacteriaceae bacterium]